MELCELKLTPKRKEIAKRLGFTSSKDVLSYYPYKYEELVITHYDDFKIGEQVFFEGELLSSPSIFRYGGKKTMTKFRVLYEEEELSITIFNRPWARNLRLNSTITIIGKYDGNNKITASNYYEKEAKEIEGIVPYYSVKEGISQNDIKKLLEFTFNKVENELIDEIPLEYVNKHNLIDYKEAIKNVHFPSNKTNLKKALARLKYEEFLRFYLALDYLKNTTTVNDKKAKEFDYNDVTNFIDSLPYGLTKDQENAINDILKDLKSNHSMYRLVQGEVGSGKTAVAMTTMYANYLSGYQSALMAPTEILAKQHYESFLSQFENTGCRIALLYSGTEESKEIKERLKKGEIDIIIGTHALFQEDVEFANLGLVIADEQHRFGVKQRRALKEKGENVDFILMSATPIPRTLASSIYGDMDISTIETMPLGRKGCDTYLIHKNSIVDIIDELKEKLDEGRQIYIIAAAIEPSENYKAKDASGLYNSLISAFAPYKLGLLHGRMNSTEKDQVMSDFNANKIQILVSTTVVEVGVNVRNATVMVIYDADKFGLSQLHQLRGRIQRGNYKGTCYLLTSNNDKDVLNRLSILTKTNNGFDISYEDLKLRGPGDILGTRQSGLPAFILGNLLEDSRFIDAAREDAKEIINTLDLPQNAQFYDIIAKEAKNKAID